MIFKKDFNKLNQKDNIMHIIEYNRKKIFLNVFNIIKQKVHILNKNLFQYQIHMEIIQH